MDIDFAPNDALMLETPTIHIEGSETIHYATAWWLPPPDSRDPAAQALAFAEKRTEVRRLRCVNEWSIE